MSKSKKHNSPAAKPRSRLRVLIPVLLFFGLAALSGAMAQLNGLFPMAKKSAGNQNVTVAPSGLSASNPSKEYVYAGGKLVATEEPITFNDVPTSHPFYADIMKIADLGVTLGCGGGNYCPDDDVTREQMAAFIIRALGVFNPPAPASQRFTDVPPTNGFYAFIEEMAVRQITLGCTATTYCPRDPVKHEQMAAFIMRARGEFSPPTPSQQRFQDVPPSNPFYNFIERMGALNIWPPNPTITGVCSAGNYCPGNNVKRGEMARILVRGFNL